MMVELTAHPYMRRAQEELAIPLLIVPTRNGLLVRIGRYYQTTERRAHLLDHLCGPFGRPSQR